jgi:FkbM family methyltransferase
MYGTLQRIARRFGDRIRDVSNIVRLYRNWPVVLFCKLRGGGSRAMLFRLRDGAEVLGRTASFDTFIMNEIWIDGIYTSLSGFSIQPDWVIADVGGHKGYFSVFAAKRAPRGKVYSFEASPENFERLVENVDRNGIPNVEAVNVAIGGRDARSTLHLYPDNGQNSLLERSDAGMQAVRDVTVEIWSMARVLEKIGSPVNLLKMDIEGMEYEALLSCPTERLRRIERIALEYHDSCVHTSHRVADLVEFLKARGFSVRLIPNREILVAEREAENSQELAQVGAAELARSVTL